MITYFVDSEGVYLGCFEGSTPEGGIEVPFAPDDARQIWDGSGWGDIPITIPERVSANQFGKQLAAMGILNQVTDWVSQQDVATQWSFNRSATFVRNDPMMETGFTALGFTSEQIDDFFLAASLL